MSFQSLGLSFLPKVISHFEADRKLEEYSEIRKINGVSYLRMMTPMYMKPDCMKCHAVLGYKVGDLRGGVNVSVPLDEFYVQAKADSIKLTFSHGAIWLLGLVRNCLCGLLGMVNFWLLLLLLFFLD